ncbi:jg8921 [Pararge aegeria aegeria]|uniref:Jg8921 protein n=1 Tax=Pararge aegeria aegeria TaxID=348720 RepID=A0A8S4SFM5_9NEOP|nr:jg8921 [Pararge aegeria aegeria]
MQCNCAVLSAVSVPRKPGSAVAICGLIIYLVWSGERLRLRYTLSAVSVPRKPGSALAIWGLIISLVWSSAVVYHTTEKDVLPSDLVFWYDFALKRSELN